MGITVLMTDYKICPVRFACFLDNKIRRWLHDPKKIVGPLIKAGMTVLDFGCGPGFFTTEIADLVGKNGKVIAADVQEEMLEKLRNKIKGTETESRIRIHRCEEDRIGIREPIDCAIAFYVIHELSNQEAFFREISNVLKDHGLLLLVEPKLFHVSGKEFEQTVDRAVTHGFERVEDMKIIFSRGVLLRKVKQDGYGPVENT